MSSMPDPLAPLSLEGEASPSNTREWDGEDAIDAFPGARKALEEQMTKEYLDAQNAAAEQEEVVEEPEEGEEEEVEAIEEPEDVIPEPMGVEAEEVDATPKAQQRIQKLVAKNKESESKMEALLEKLAAAELARQDSETRRQQEVAYERAVREQEFAKQQRMQQLEAAGFDPTDPRNQYMLAVDDVILKQNAELQQIRNELNQRQQQEVIKDQWNTFNSRLDKAFDSVLAGRKLDAEAHEILKQSAVSLAYRNQSADPIEEVRTVLRPYMKLLKTPAPVQKMPAPVEDVTAHRAIALKGTTGNKKPGDKAGQSKPGKISMDQAREALWGSAKTVWDK